MHKHHARSVTSMCVRAAIDFNIVSIVWPTSSSVTEVRCRGAAAIFHDTRPDYSLWIDSDIAVPSDTLHRLYAHGREIVGARYRRRSYPHDKLGLPLPYEGTEPKTGLLEMELMPMGCMLIKTEVFEKFPDDRPYFMEQYIGQDMISEDHVWCARARDLGFRIYADMDLSREITHFGEMGINEDCAPMQLNRLQRQVNRLLDENEELKKGALPCTSQS